MGCWCGWFVVYWVGDFVEWYCYLWGDGDGCVVRCCVLLLGWFVGVSVNYYGCGVGGYFVGDFVFDGKSQ